jgi:hypothetical protein
MRHIFYNPCWRVSGDIYSFVNCLSSLSFSPLLPDTYTRSLRRDPVARTAERRAVTFQGNGGILR